MKMIITSFLVMLLYLTSCNEDSPNDSDESPMITVTNPSNKLAVVNHGDELSINLDLADDKGLKKLTLFSRDLDVFEEVELNGEKEFQFSSSVSISVNAGTYELLITIVDTGSNEEEETILIDVKESNALTVLVNANQTYQTIQNFGASDAWSTQFVGDNWPLTDREEIAELLFSAEKDEFGNPLGIGLSGWRFNIGGGSAEQSSGSGITDRWRRAETFLNADGSYDWNKQSGQVWFLKKAAEYGVSDFVGFVNSPPVHYAKNGKAYSDDGAGSNLKTEHYNDYALFLAEVAKNLSSVHGVELDYISPVNEPQWDWKCCNQEGSPWNNSELTAIIKEIDAVFTAQNVTAKIDITEAGQIVFLYGDRSPNSRANQIDYFYNPSSLGYVGDLENISMHISGHSYFTTFDVNNLRSTRESLRSSISSSDPNLEYWMSEYTILENNSEIVGNGRDLSINPALYMARVVHADLVYANAVAWQWWLAISPYDYKDGLIYIDKTTSGSGYLTSKMLWGLGNYSHFIRPGMQRVQVSRSDNPSSSQSLEGLMQSAFKSNDEIVVVFVNYGTDPKEVNFELTGRTFESATVYQTSSTKNLEFVKTITPNESVLIGGRSIVTCVLK